MERDPFPAEKVKTESPFRATPYTIEQRCPKCYAPWWNSPMTTECICSDAPGKHYHLVCHAEKDLLVCGFGWILVNL